MKLDSILPAFIASIWLNKLPKLYIKVGNMEYTFFAISKDFGNLYKTQCINKLFSVI